MFGASESELAKLALAHHVDGHAPGVLGRAAFWLVAANLVYAATLGPEPPASAAGFQ